MDNDVKYTPGPWDITYTRDGKMALINDGYVCSIELDGNPEGEANTKLIASAPDLLEALQRTKATMERDKNGGYRLDYNGNACHEVGSTYVMVCEAIKKAKA